jgi:ribosomal protein S18 acetylase RimI-like enzyme
VSTRDAVPSDAPAIAHVHVETWRGAYAHAFPADYLAALDPARRARFWRETVERGDDVLVAERDGRVVGFASVGPSPGDDGARGELYAIYVLPEAWGTGMGRELLTAAVDRLTARGFAEAILWVLEDNPRARRFYEAGGWRADGERRTETIGGIPAGEVRYGRVLTGGS